jgi:hypothetical protein
LDRAEVDRAVDHGGNVITIWGRELSVLIHTSFAFSFKGALRFHSRELPSRAITGARLIQGLSRDGQPRQSARV